MGKHFSHLLIMGSATFPRLIIYQLLSWRKWGGREEKGGTIKKYRVFRNYFLKYIAFSSFLKYLGELYMWGKRKGKRNKLDLNFLSSCKFFMLHTPSNEHRCKGGKKEKRKKVKVSSATIKFYLSGRKERGQPMQLQWLIHSNTSYRSSYLRLLIKPGSKLMGGGGKKRREGRGVRAVTARKIFRSAVWLLTSWELLLYISGWIFNCSQQAVKEGEGRRGKRSPGGRFTTRVYHWDKLLQ